MLWPAYALALVLFVSLYAPASAKADELALGVLAHGIDTPFTFRTDEHGADVQLSYRFDIGDALDAIGAPAPYLIASLNSSGYTNFAGGGLGWTIGKGPVYFRPAIGVVIHSGPSHRIASDGRRTDLGSRVLFEPEASVGLRLSQRVAIEANWTHISHARLFNRDQNPGIDMFGARAAIAF